MIIVVIIPLRLPGFSVYLNTMAICPKEKQLYAVVSNLINLCSEFTPQSTTVLLYQPNAAGGVLEGSRRCRGAPDCTHFTFTSGKPQSDSSSISWLYGTVGFQSAEDLENSLWLCKGLSFVV